MFDRYNIRNLVRVVRNLELVMGEKRRIRRDFIRHSIKAASYYYSYCGPTHRVHVMDQDWDNLLIMDAARYDISLKKFNRSFDVEAKFSKGSWSGEFIDKNFTGKYHDTIYITANPHLDRVESGTFYLAINLLKKEWDSKYRTVRPEDAAEVARTVKDDHPNKRIIVHFMQPHFPFINKNSERIQQQGIEDHLPNQDQKSEPNPWFDLLWGDENNPKEVIKAYISNYDTIVPIVQELGKDMHGKSIITSDHGNLLGERLFPIPIKGYGHPIGLHKPELLKVPWIKIDSDSRPNIYSELPVKNNKNALTVNEEQLRALGYT